MGKPSAQRRLQDNEAMAFAKVVRTSPQKLNLLAGLIRGLDAQAARNELAFSPLDRPLFGQHWASVDPGLAE